ncbi:MAG TPA: hypothetical protein VFT99_08100, partial [Roseiflexaceae bacterium]|nr:hypothetical protein [Roseiflexaceae bacterium]
GEFQASKMLSQAANQISSEPAALQLRYLQTLTEIAVEKNSTIVFPLPVDTLKIFIDGLRHASGDTRTNTAPLRQPNQSLDDAGDGEL